jgi:hypothetical protein
MIGKDLFFDLQRSFIDQAVAIIVLAVTRLCYWLNRSITNDAHAAFGAHVFALDALANPGPLAASFPKRPIFINLHVAVVVHPVARFDI